MDALYYVVLSLFVLVCILLVVVILLQSSQTGGMGAAIGGTAFNAAFGGQGADKLLVKITTVLAVLFLSFAITLNMLDTPGASSNDGINMNAADPKDDKAPASNQEDVSEEESEEN